jgi:hypothetical protein
MLDYCPDLKRDGGCNDGRDGYDVPDDKFIGGFDSGDSDDSVSDSSSGAGDSSETGGDSSDDTSNGTSNDTSNGTSEYHGGIFNDDSDGDDSEDVGDDGDDNSDSDIAGGDDLGDYISQSAGVHDDSININDFLI